MLFLVSSSVLRLSLSRNKLEVNDLPVGIKLTVGNGADFGQNEEIVCLLIACFLAQQAFPDMLGWHFMNYRCMYSNVYSKYILYEHDACIHKAILGYSYS